MTLEDLKMSMLNIVTATIESKADKYKKMYAELLLMQINNERTYDIQVKLHLACNDLIVLHKTLTIINNMKFKIAEDEPLSIYGTYCDRITMAVSKDELNKQDINRLTFVSMFELFMAFQNMFAEGNGLTANAVYAVQCLSIIYNLKTMLDDSIMDVVSSSRPVTAFLRSIKKILTNNNVIYLATDEQIADRQNKVLTDSIYGKVIDTIIVDDYKGIVLDLNVLFRYSITPVVKHNIMSLFFDGNNRIHDIENVPSKVCSATLAKHIMAEAKVKKEKFDETKLINEANEIVEMIRSASPQL